MKADEAISLAVLIPVYNSLNYTKTALVNLSESIKQAAFSIINHQIQILIFDDGSSDNTFEYVSKYYPGIILLRGDGNNWWGGSINRMAHIAFENLMCTHILLWNNDIIIKNDYFTELLSILAKQDGNSLTGSKIFFADKPGIIWLMGGYFNPMTGKKTLNGFKRPDSPEFERTIDADWLTGMGTVIPKTVVDKIGYLDSEQFPQYHGDVDFSYRAKCEGFKLRVFPQLKIWNCVQNTGLDHQLSFRKLIESMNSTRSIYNVKKDIEFYHKHVKSPLAYFALFDKYTRYLWNFFRLKLKPARKPHGKTRVH
ncbi:MAG: glycosyltransferase family 2 protein [Bacteroidota bacterium]|nr:glycosyltransferase family 2 protein [Bacteroidota bacterium]